VSATTRPPRPDEVEGQSYFFVSRERFEEWLATDGLLEWARVYDSYYGTPREPVERALAQGRSVLLDIDTQGAFQVMDALPQAVSIFIEPPSDEELERRLRERGTESEEQLRLRLAAAGHEMAHRMRYTYRLVNDDVQRAESELLRIIAAEEQEECEV